MSAHITYVRMHTWTATHVCMHVSAHVCSNVRLEPAAHDAQVLSVSPRVAGVSLYQPVN